MHPSSHILITGATGYVGGRLLGLLQKKGYSLRCLVRRPQALAREIKPSTEVVVGDVLDPSSIQRALQGIHTAYYLIHSLGTAKDFEGKESQGAQNFAGAAQKAGVKKIIYLGGLGAGEGELSQHLRSRHEVGRLLNESGIPVIEFRASIILGSGSVSFEMVRALVERLPVMVTPRWVRTPAQPIAVEDVLEYLVEALNPNLQKSQVFEIGGADQVSYGGIMKEYARQRGLKRLMIPVPVLTPKLSSLWLNLVTPVYARIGKKLVESIRYPTLVRDDSALKQFTVKPMGVRKAIERALVKEDQDFAQTHWSSALSSVGENPYGGQRYGNRLVDSRALTVPVGPESAFRPLQCIGGNQGWYFADFLWKLRGAFDSWVGGVGLRRGRRDPQDLRVGDALDFWRVEALDPPKKMLLRAEMKLPGRAWLEFEVNPRPQGSEIRQTAIFDPKGLQGLLYWYLLYPIHHFIFKGMLREIARQTQ